MTFHVENYPGFPESITGPDLVDRMTEQAKKFGAEIDERTVTGVDLSSRPYRLMIDDEEIVARSVIIATGSNNRLLGLESEARFMGRGVFVCATCDAVIYEDLKVVAVGGGDSALQEALDIAKYAREVEIVHRGKKFTASNYLKEEVLKNEKIKLRFNAVVEEILGDDLDPVLSEHCEQLANADGIVLIHPNWWGMPPAILKGWVDRVVRPEVAYRFEEDDSGEGIPVGLLKAKAAVVFNTSNTPEKREQEVFGDPLENLWKNCIFDLCGVKEFHRRNFEVVVTSTEEKRKGWLAEAAALVERTFP